MTQTETHTLTDRTPRTWFITGATSGFGRAIAERALATAATP